MPLAPVASCYARDRRASPSCWDQLIRSFAGLFCARRVRRVERARETVPVCWSLEGWDSVFYLCMRWVWMCGCVSCSCAPQSAMLRVGSLGWMYRGGVGWGGAFFLAAPRFVRVFARSSCTELIRTGEPRRTFFRYVSRSAAPPPARPCRLTPPNLTCSERAAYGESDREQSNTQIARWKRRLNNVMIPKLLFTR